VNEDVLIINTPWWGTRVHIHIQWFDDVKLLNKNYNDWSDFLDVPFHPFDDDFKRVIMENREFGEGIIDHFTKSICVAFRGLKSVSFQSTLNTLFRLTR